MFWDLTYREIEHVMRDASRQERAANLRAGLIAATIVNVRLKKGRRLVRPSDFIREPKKHMSVEEAARFMDQWAADQNLRLKKEAR